MDLVTLQKHFVDARRLARELLHRRYLARKAYSELCTAQAIGLAQGRTISTYEKIALRTLSLERKNWQELAVLQVAVFKAAHRAWLWEKIGQASGRA